MKFVTDSKFLKKITNKFMVVFFLIAIFFFSCQTKKKQGLVSKEKNPISKPLLIKGIADDPVAFSFVNFIDYSNFKGTNISDDYPIKTVYETYTEYKWGSVEQSQIIEFFSMGDSANYNTRMFIRPGDSISLFIKNKTIQFEGKKAAQFNFFNQLDPLSNEWASIKFEGSLNAYKRQADSIYHRRQTFFNEYVSKHDLSKDFVVEVGAELKFEYLFNLMVPRQADDLSEYNFNKENIVHLIAKDWGNDNEILFDFDSYFEGVSLTDFKRPELLSNDYFKRSLIEFIRYYFVHDQPITFSMDNFEKEKTFIEKHFEGGLEEFAVTSLFYDYHEKGLGQGKAEKPILKSKLRKEKSRIKDSSLIEVLDRLDEKLSTLGSPFFKSDIEDEFINLVGDTLSINSILSKTPDKIVVLDFWASWCTPCLKEIVESQSLRTSLKEKNEVQWIFISIDHEEERWRAMTKRLKPYIDNSQNHYRLIDYARSSTVRYLNKGQMNLFLIPRYVILDKNLDIAYSQAPRPSDSLLFKKLIQKLKGIN